MILEEALVARLAADATVAGLVGARIYPQILPQDPVYPALSYATVSAVRDDAFGGPAGRAQPRIAIHCWATGYRGAKTLAAAVRLALQGWRGDALDGSSPPAVIGRIRAALLDNEVDLYEDGPRVHHVVQDWLIAHDE